MNSNHIIWISLFLLACSPQKETVNDDSTPEPLNVNISGPMQVTIEGTAHNRKGGAVVLNVVNQQDYWIEDLDFWPDSLVNQTVIVTGILEQRSDAPVFMDTSELKSQGIPVYSEDQAEEASKRLWIKNANWKLKN